MGSISRNGNSWRVFIQIGEHRATKQFKTKAEAAEWMVHTESDMRSGLMVHKTGFKTFKELCERWIELGQHRKGIRWEKIRLMSFCKNEYLNVPLAQLNQLAISNWMNGRLNEVSAGSVVRDCNLLKALFTKAQKEWLAIKRNPFDGIKLPREPDHRERLVTVDEIGELVEKGTGFSKMQDLAIVVFLFLYETGMRLGEATSLTWGDIKDNVATVRDGKTGKRRVPLTKQAYEYINMFKDRERDKPIFGADSSQISSNFRKVKERLGFDYQLRDSRHAAITRIISQTGINQHDAGLIFGNRTMLHVYYNRDVSDIANQIEKAYQ